jgi:predicted transcriptional regulator
MRGLHLNNYSILLFELASEDRLNILLLLKRTPLKLSHVSAKLNFTVQETSRNMTRLTEAGLITKDADSLFHLTAYGKEALNLLSGFRFLYKNKDYFANHTLATLPNQFRNSIGILEPCKYSNDVMTTFHNVELMIDAAEEIVWILTDQILASTIPYLLRAVQRGVQFHLLMPKGYLPTDNIRSLVLDPIFSKAVKAGKLDLRFLDKIDVFLCVSEKEVSALAFQNVQGNLEYSAFESMGTDVIEWSKALFTHYWNRASSQIPDQLYQPT